MLLKDFRKSPAERFDDINQSLKENFNIRVGTNVKLIDVKESILSLSQKIYALKVAGEKIETSSELSKLSLMKEALEILERNTNMLAENKQLSSYITIVNGLAHFVAQRCIIGDDFDDSVREAMREYRSSKWRFDDNRVEADVRARAADKLTDQAPIAAALSEDEIEHCKSWVIGENVQLDRAVRTKLHEFYLTRGETPGKDNDIDDWFAERLTKDLNIPA